MTFTLTDSLLSEIQAALDNQEKKFLVKADLHALVEKTDGLEGDDINFYELPEWTSANGFKLREDFVLNLHSPVAKEELQEVLHSGRGVFKNFRNVLRDYPEVEKKWHIYKNRIMLEYINGWYNNLREIWGLEKLDYVPESDENLIHDDFTFSAYDSDTNKQELLLHVNAAFMDRNQDLPEELLMADYNLWYEQFENAEAKGQIGFVCRSYSDDFAGCITVSTLSRKQEQVMFLTSLFVPEAFRGLGIGTELLSVCLSELKKHGKKWLILPQMIVPEILESLLLRIGYKKIDSGYAVQI